MKNWPIFINRSLIFRSLASTLLFEKLEHEKDKKTTTTHIHTKHIATNGADRDVMAIIGWKTLIHRNIMVGMCHGVATCRLSRILRTLPNKGPILSVQLIPICGIYCGWSAWPFSRDSTLREFAIDVSKTQICDGSVRRFNFFSLGVVGGLFVEL